MRLDYESPEPLTRQNSISVNPSDERAVEIASEFVNRVEPNAVLLQHEFKLFGGDDGENVLRFLGRISSRIVTTLHTVSPMLPVNRQRILKEIVRRSAKLIVFSETARRILTECYSVEAGKVVAIPHGVPDMPYTAPGAVELPEVPRRGVTFVTCGLMRPAKGIEEALAAFARVHGVEFTYVICGADHPRNPAAREYRHRLQDIVARRGLKDHVVFLNSYMAFPDLVRVIKACDVGMFPYTAPWQSSSGALALTLSCGRPVISTDFQFAKAVVNDSTGILVPTGKVERLAASIESIALNPLRREQMGSNGYELTRRWTWRNVVYDHLKVLA